MMRPTRPVLRWLGGKFRLADWIVSQFPPHDTYCEPFGGAASVLLAKPPCRTEVYNDLDDDLVGLFRVLRDDALAARLIRQIELTPFSRAEFLAAYEPCEEPVERARRLVVRSFMGFGSCAARKDRTTGFRTGARKGDAPASREWSTYPPSLWAVVERLKGGGARGANGVSIERRPASQVIAMRDHPTALFYVDPPYMHGTRSPKRTRTAPSNGYTHELNDADHIALLEHLCRVEGMVILSGYASAIYDRLLVGWTRVERQTVADGARPRTEILWSNPAATAARAARQVAA